MTAEMALTSFGFTDSESRLYFELLRNGPSSGYRIAQIVGKAPANAYQSLRSLAQKGAVVHSDGMGEATTYSPTPPDQLFAMLRQSFDEREAAAKTALKKVYRRSGDQRVYNLQTVAQVFERARGMMADAKEIMLVDFFPAIYDLLRDEIDAARARGVTVAGIAYDPRHAGPGMPLNKQSIDLVQSRWPGLGLLLVVDGAQQLIAQISSDMNTVLHAVWSDSVFMSCIFHSTLAADIRLVALRTDPSDPLRGITLQGSTPPGLREILAQDGRGPEPTGSEQDGRGPEPTDPEQP